MATELHGVRVDVDGTRTDITIPAGTRLSDYFREQLGGWPEYGHYGTAADPTGITAVVHETSARDMPVNGAATTFACQIRSGQLDYYLHGPVFFFGFDRACGATVSLTGEQRAVLGRLPVYSKGGAGRG